MCVAIAIPAGERMTRKQFDRGWASNPDGGGLAYISGKHVVTRHSMTRKELWRMYREAVTDAPDSDMLVHMRIATHGSVCLANCHPFVVDNGSKFDTVFAHNGVIPGLGDSKTDMSDSRMFGTLFLQELPTTWFDNPAITDLVESYINYDKMVVLTTERTAKQNLYILNEDLGITEGKVWFSNTSCKATKFKAYKAPAVTPGAWSMDSSGVWTAPTPVNTKAKSKPFKTATAARAHSDGESGIAKGEIRFFPYGADFAFGALDLDDAIDIYTEAMDLGYCEVCMWKQCNCLNVCHDCTLLREECDCAEGSLYVPLDADVTDYGQLGIPGRRRPVPEGHVGPADARTSDLTGRSIHDLTDSEYATISDDDFQRMLAEHPRF